MTGPIYIALSRDDVISYLGRAWPPRPGQPCLTIADEAGITDGVAVVYPVDGQPGTCWWVVDRLIPTQDAGTPDEALAALLPGSVLGAIPSPGPDPDEPPQDRAPQD
jgi:hypothetical protein